MSGVCQNCMRRFQRPGGKALKTAARFQDLLGDLKPANSLSEVPDHSCAHEKVMLATLSRVHVQLGNAGKKVAHFAAHAKAAKQFDIETPADREDSACGPGFPGLGPKNSSEELSLK